MPDGSYHGERRESCYRSGTLYRLRFVRDHLSYQCHETDQKGYGIHTIQRYSSSLYENIERKIRQTKRNDEDAEIVAGMMR